MPRWETGGGFCCAGDCRVDDREAKFKEIRAGLDKWMRDVKTKVAELKMQPDSPERQAELDALKNASLGILRSLEDLAATVKRKYGGQTQNPPNNT